MKLKYLLIFIALFFLVSSVASGQKTQMTNMTELRRDSIVKLLKIFGQSADLYYDQFVTQRSGVDYLSNEEGTSMFKNLFQNPNDTCIFNYMDTIRIARTPFPRNSLKENDSVPDSRLRFCNSLTLSEYIQLHELLYSGGQGSSSDLDTVSIRVVDVSEKKSFGNKYMIDVLANVFFSGENDSLPERYVYDNQRLWFSIIYEKYKIKDEVIFRNFRILKIRQRPVAQPGENPPIDSTHVFSLEPFLQAGFNGGNHIYNESWDNYLSGKAGLAIDMGVNFSIPFKISEDGKFLDLGIGLGYSLLTLPVTINDYEFVNSGITPPFLPSSFFKKYDYTQRISQVDENHLFGFVNIPVFAKLRIPLKNELSAFFKLGVYTYVPVHSGYRPDGNISYTGTFHYVVNNKEVVISTDEGDANLAGTIPNYNALYGDKESLSWEKLKKSPGVSARFETGIIMKTTERINYNLGAYVTYRISGMKYGNDAALIGQEGKINSFLTKTDKVDPLGFGLTMSVTFNKFRNIYLENK